MATLVSAAMCDQAIGYLNEPWTGGPLTPRLLSLVAQSGPFAAVMKGLTVYAHFFLQP